MSALPLGADGLPAGVGGGPSAGAVRVCRVAVDVLAVERLFDYLVPEALAGAVGVGTIVRVNLGGRRVRGWVVEDEVVSEAPAAKLRPLLAVVSAGPPPEIVGLTAWASWRFAGPRLPLLRAASPPAIVPPGPFEAPLTNRRSSGTGGLHQERRFPSAAVGPAPGRVSDEAAGLAVEEAAGLAAEAAGAAVAVVRWPPATGAGDLVAGLLSPSGSTVVVVPDGRLAGLASRLRATGATVVPWLTEGRPRDRARAWDHARRGGCVVLGGRSAVLAPVPDLAAVVVVDDGSESLKEERSPTWHARDLAAERARRRRARLTVVSPAPPLEAPGPVLVPARAAERAGWPITEVVDRRREPPGLGLFSSRAVAALRAVTGSAAADPERLSHRICGLSARGPQSEPDRVAGTAEGGVRAVCVLNRRGRARLLACGTCAELARCEACTAAVGEGEGDLDGVPSLACGRCGATRPRVCVACGSTRLKVLRSGVTRVREDLAALLPGVGVAMVDAATGDLPAEPVLIGTEAVLHRVEPHPAGTTALVVFLDFDSELLAPRFRAAEQALWLLIRSARLVGPRSAGGRVLVQTRLPRHEVLEAAVHADPARLADAERPRRELLGLPPYGALARLTGDAPALAAAAEALRSAGGGIGVSGIGDDAVLVRAASADRLADALEAALAAGRPAGRLRAEADPLRI